MTIECDYSFPLLRLVRCFEEQEVVKVHLRLLLPQGSQRRYLHSRRSRSRRSRSRRKRRRRRRRKRKGREEELKIEMENDFFSLTT